MLRLWSALLLLLALLPVAAEEAFWVETPEEVEAGWRTFRPADDGLRNQGFLLYRVVPTPEGSPVVVREVLGSLHRDVEELKVAGQKEVEWRDGVGTLVSFSGKQDGESLLGRMVLASRSDGTEILLLIRHPQADPALLQNFERARRAWPDFSKRVPVL